MSVSSYNKATPAAHNVRGSDSRITGAFTEQMEVLGSQTAGRGRGVVGEGGQPQGRVALSPVANYL